MRNVRVYKFSKEPGDKYMKKVPDGTAKFHQFGLDYQELDNGIGNFSAAVIERDDGTVKLVPADMIEFIK